MPNRGARGAYGGRSSGRQSFAHPGTSASVSARLAGQLQKRQEIFLNTHDFDLKEPSPLRQPQKPKRNVRIHFVDDPIFKNELLTWEDGHPYRRDLKAGDASFQKSDDGSEHLSFICPCGCGAAHMVSLSRGEKQDHTWLFNGNYERPTLTPSLGLYPRRDGSYDWHGFLTDGEFREC